MERSTTSYKEEKIVRSLLQKTQKEGTNLQIPLIKVGPNSRHGLSTWYSRRMEPPLEKSHHALDGSLWELWYAVQTVPADALILRGLTETNTQVQFAGKVKIIQFCIVFLHFEHLPLQWDH